jgi:hypothetical protein
MSGAPAWERVVDAAGSTISRIIRGVVSYYVCGPTTPTCSCCPESMTTYAIQMTSTHVLNIQAWAGLN